jgi:RNA polymerase sigma-70 factor (sigma-E family)
MDASEALAMTARSQPPPRPTIVELPPRVAVDPMIDRVGFDELYRAEFEPMVRLAYLLTGDRETALEVTHDAFVVTCERWSRLDRPGGYLRTAVVNRCRDLGRRQRFRSSAPVPERSVVDPDDDLADAIAALPPKRRAAVVLRYYLDLTEADIAETLGVRPGTVKSLLSRGLAELKASLRERTSTSPVTTNPGEPS